MSDVSPVSRSSGAHPADDDANTSSVRPYAPLDPFAELAALLVENDFLRSELDERQLRAARDAQARAMRDEVNAMHRAADAIVVQAYVQGGAAALGGIAQLSGSLGRIGNTPPPVDADQAARCDYRKCELRYQSLDKAGGALGNVAEPLGQLTGGTERAHADADAAQARNAGEQASFEVNELSAHRERVEKHTDSLLELIESTLDSEHQGHLAILARF